MIYESLIAIVEQNIEKLAQAWYVEIKRSEYMKTYNALSDEEILNRGRTLFSNLLKWLGTGADNEEIENFFENVGANRIKEGFPLSEVNYALYLEKKVLWSFVLIQDEITVTLSASDAVDFMNILNNYFDLGDFFIIRGYMNELFKHLDESRRFTKEELENLLTHGALSKESLEEIRAKLYEKDKK